jgi:hypothetical protein
MHCSRVDAFRHRAASIIADRIEVGYAYHRLTLTAGLEPFPFRLNRNGALDS